MAGYQEFVPRISHQMGGQASELAQFANRAQLPHWSPQTKGQQQQGQGQNASAYAGMPPSALGMNSTARAFVPGQPSRPNAPRPTSATGAGAGEEALVEVTVNGNTFFVPESMAGAEGAETLGLDTVDDGLSFWTNNSTTLPAPPKRSLQTIGIPDPIRQHFQSLDIEALRQMAPEDERYKEMPNRYHSAYALDNAYSQAQRGSGGSYGYPSSVYKVVDSSDSQMYALRRFDNVRTSATVVKNALVKWGEIRHPAIVSLYNISQERGGVFFTHAYYPSAQTLRQRFIDQRGALLSETLLWRILCQLLSALRLVHLRGMALRNVSPTHVLLTSGTCAKFSGVGVFDVLEFESRKTLADMQQEDLVKLGYLLLSLSMRFSVGPKNVEQALAHMQQHFSADINHVVGTLLVGKATSTQVCHLMSQRIHDELDQALAANDALQSHLRNEYENGRLLRLLLKLGFVNERPEYARAPQWSETGDRYVLKLFRDYVFHQAMAEGAPSLDAGHVVSALNKLDSGDPEKILLSSRDNKDLLVVSFADVRRCVRLSLSPSPPSLPSLNFFSLPSHSPLLIHPHSPFLQVPRECLLRANFAS
jgi:PAB-dependent poly(A)-specific ribonuclease subunit 3